MNKSTKILKLISVCVFMFFATLGSAQESKNNQVSLPEAVCGEWYSDSGTGEYNGVLIHQDFMEWGYRAFMYQDIVKISDTSYNVSSEDVWGNKLYSELTIISKDSIQLKRGDNPLLKYALRDAPKDSKRITLNDVPEIIKKKWFTTDGKNDLEFDLTNEKFSFRNKNYNIVDIVDFTATGKDEYRFIVKNDKKYWMFYFKNWDENYLQVGFQGKNGDLYKANKDYPDYRIENVSAYMASIVPKVLRGDWLKADGSNLWSHSLYYNFAVLNCDKWQYKTVKKKGSIYILTLERNGEEKVMYAKPTANATVNFGFNKNELTAYSLKKINNPNLKLKEDVVNNEDSLLKNGMATYSGIIKNFSKNSNEKTGKVIVNNLFTGEQDGYLIEIKDDGSFSVSFPSYHLQQVYVRLPGSYYAIYVEPGKETKQFINSGDRIEGFFAGDLQNL